MPLMDKELADDQKKQNAHLKHLRELEFENHEHSEETDVNYLTPTDHNIKSKVEEKSQKRKQKKNHLETIIENLNRLQAQRTSFQERIEQANQQPADQIVK